ncbi:FAD-binding domain-containing protein [Mycena capillaripes]|nr:FAD-binding domain-containing protein [Mycena capillaripes]
MALNLVSGLSLLSLLTAVSSIPILDVSAAQWKTLNATVGGRLHTATPFALPCFSSYNNLSVAVDEPACSAIKANYTSPKFRLASFSANMNVEYEMCMSTHSRCLLDTANPNSLLATAGTSCKQGQVPPFYIDVRVPSDIQAAFQFSNDTGVPVSIKNIGHDYMGRSRRPNSLALWTHNLQTMNYDPQFVPELCPSSGSHRAITVGAGVTFEQVYEFADENDAMFIGGYAQTVGVSGGWMMGGGHSVLSPSFGLGVDRVASPLEIKIATPDGQLRTANACQNPDLFWALRGGGGGTFGVVIESTHIVEQRIPIQVINMTFVPTTTNLQEYFEILVNTSAQWGEQGWGGHLSAFALENNGTATLETLPSWYEFYQRFIVQVQVMVGNSMAIGSRLVPKSLFKSADGRAQIVALLLRQTAERGMPYIPVGTPIAFNYTPGATSITPAWRDALWHIRLTSSSVWPYNSSVADVTAVLESLHDYVADDLTTLVPDTGAYMNEGDVYQDDHEYTYWGTNYARLLAIKQQYDPNSLLDCWKCVGWKGAADFPCYPTLSA